MIPLFVPGFPGLPELIIAFLIFGLYLVIPILLIVIVYNFLDGKRGYEERITQLEQRVERLENEN